MTLEKDRIIGNDAKQLLENPLLKDAFAAVDGYLNDKALSCDPDNKEMAQRIILSKQLLVGIRREIERKIDDGMVAEVQINELEKRRIFGGFRR